MTLGSGLATVWTGVSHEPTLAQPQWPQDSLPAAPDMESSCHPGPDTHLFTLGARRSEGSHDAFVSLQEIRQQGVRARGREESGGAEEEG